MRTLLICPADRTPMGFMARHVPLALVPVLGRSLIDLWLSELATHGAREVLVLATDRPERIRAAIGMGERWGVKARVIPESRELTPEEARSKYGVNAMENWMPAPMDICVLDRLPGQATSWADLRTWFHELRAQLPSAAPDRIGMREVSRGILIHGRARIAPSARLEAPSWVGAYAAIGARARIGPGSVIEDGAYVDEGATVVDSFVGPWTYVGAMTELRESLAWGRGLLNWSTGSCTEVTDEFLLAEIGQRSSQAKGLALPGRLLALIALVTLSPLVLLAWLRRNKSMPFLVTHQAVRAPLPNGAMMETCRYHQLQGVSGLWSRWPELWNIVCGEFAWIGNRPLTREQAEALESDWERLWLAVPPGVISPADAEECPDPLGDEARAHASFYAVQRDRRADWRILRRTFARAWTHDSGMMRLH
jgi:hypothetical protein